MSELVLSSICGSGSSPFLAKSGPGYGPILAEIGSGFDQSAREILYRKFHIRIILIFHDGFNNVLVPFHVLPEVTSNVSPPYYLSKHDNIHTTHGGNLDGDNLNRYSFLLDTLAIVSGN